MAADAEVLDVADVLKQLKASVARILALLDIADKEQRDQGIVMPDEYRIARHALGGVETVVFRAQRRLERLATERES